MPNVIISVKRLPKGKGNAPNPPAEFGDEQLMMPPKSDERKMIPPKSDERKMIPPKSDEHLSPPKSDEHKMIPPKSDEHEMIPQALLDGPLQLNKEAS